MAWVPINLYFFSGGEGTGTRQLHQYWAVLVGTSGDTRKKLFYLVYTCIFLLNFSLSFWNKSPWYCSELLKVVAEESKLGKLRMPLMVPGTWGSKLIVRKDFKALTHMQVEALPCVPSGYSILSCFSCRWDFPDNSWAWILGQSAQNASGKRENLSPPPHFCTSTPTVWALFHIHLGVCSEFLFLLHWGTSPTEGSLSLHSILSLHILKRSTVSHPTVCESEVKMLFPFPLCDTKLEILIHPSGFYIVTWSSATQYFFILVCVRSCSSCETKKCVEQKL